MRLQDRGRVVFTAAIDGAVFARHGTRIDTRLTVIDKLPADDPSRFPGSPGIAPDVTTLMGWIEAHVPKRSPVSLPKIVVPASTIAPKTVRGYLARATAARPAAAPANDPEGVELAYETVDWTPPEALACPMPSMRNMRCNRFAFPAPRRTRPSWCSPPPWPPSHLRSPPTGRCCPPTSVPDSPTPNLKR